MKYTDEQFRVFFDRVPSFIRRHSSEWNKSVQEIFSALPESPRVQELEAQVADYLAVNARQAEKLDAAEARIVALESQARKDAERILELIGRMNARPTEAQVVRQAVESADLRELHADVAKRLNYPSCFAQPPTIPEIRTILVAHADHVAGEYETWWVNVYSGILDPAKMVASRLHNSRASAEDTKDKKGCIGTFPILIPKAEKERLGDVCTWKRNRPEQPAENDESDSEDLPERCETGWLIPEESIAPRLADHERRLKNLEDVVSAWSWTLDVPSDNQPAQEPK